MPWTELAQRDPQRRGGAGSAHRRALRLCRAGRATARRCSATTRPSPRSSARAARSTARSRRSARGLLLDRPARAQPRQRDGLVLEHRHAAFRQAMPHAGHLAPLLAQHEFQEAFKNYRDLQFLARNLQGWSEALSVFGDMLANRRKAYAEQLPQVRAQTPQDTELAKLRQRRDLLADELQRADRRGRRRRLLRRHAGRAAGASGRAHARRSQALPAEQQPANAARAPAPCRGRADLGAGAAVPATRAPGGPATAGHRHAADRGAAARARAGTGAEATSRSASRPLPRASPRSTSASRP